MQINRHMNIGQLQERMGAEATHEEAATMVEFLIVSDYEDTDQIGEAEWNELLEMACEAVIRNAEMKASREQ